MRGVPKELESGRARTNHGCGSGLPAGDLALGATPGRQPAKAMPAPVLSVLAHAG